MTFVLSVWRATMNINMNPWRGNLVFFSLTGLFTQRRKSIQVNVMANLSEPVHGSVNSAASPLRLLSPSHECGRACIGEKHFVSSATVANTTVWKSDWIRCSHELSSKRHQSATATNSFLSIIFFFGVFTQPFLLLWCLEI